MAASDKDTAYHDHPTGNTHTNTQDEVSHSLYMYRTVAKCTVLLHWSYTTTCVLFKFKQLPDYYLLQLGRLQGFLRPVMRLPGKHNTG